MSSPLDRIDAMVARSVEPRPAAGRVSGGGMRAAPAPVADAPAVEDARSLAKPKTLSKELAAIWDEVAPEVKATIGRFGMESLCSQIARMRDAQARIDKEGLVVADKGGNPVAHPAIAIEKTAGTEIRNWMGKYAIG